jgi:hypothetical protein
MAPTTTCQDYYDAAVTLLLGPLYYLKSGPSSTAGARIADGTPFRLCMSVREHNNQTYAHFEVIPNKLTKL